MSESSTRTLTVPTAPRGETGTVARSGRSIIWVFLAPTVIGLGLFNLVPIVGSFVLAFFRWDIISDPVFVGVDNFVDLAMNPTVRVSFLNTIGFVVVAVILQLTVALVLAILVQSKMPAWLRTFFRSSLFFPLILSAASVSLIMAYLFNQEFGLVNQTLNLIGIADVGWLTTGFGAKVVVLLVYVWQNFGFTFLLFIGGLAAIPSEVYEASSLDGAAGWTQFRMITLPLVSPTLLVASVMAIINALQIFDQPWVLSRGGPGDETRTAVMVIYESAFRELDFGGASAIGIVLTLLIMLVTAIQFRLSRRFVFYG
ncbi:carbohydrate ABC transporter permease [Microbacterium foliorum]|uniref:Lactose transport system permease protein LacF n=1 Tax=Microbacterium foliorum TaxID=104336 RepID=A0A0F0KM07_9MICO|nr:sugar ABC transporter permease [Microbacterium foliorum]KJL20286.1 Lactose transport system permease protein LacF [Microbacterium foliorum]CAH0140584.1 Lactose transport system permease protein LacF [Microbacterium foliorum]CAH0188323.1 Lactose transport system permease protein LacF [Microbacterium foliorum]